MNLTKKLKLTKPTVLINKEIVLNNIQKISDKANASGIDFRPHFKTHNSIEIGEWFQLFNIDKITVSSIDMAEKFESNGWKDITFALPVNILEIERINKLAKNIKLHLITDDNKSIQFLTNNLKDKIYIWLDIDTGHMRTGISWRYIDEITELVKTIQKSKKMQLQGILTHSGHAYEARGKNEIHTVYLDTVNKMINIQERLQTRNLPKLRISIGDTPTCNTEKAFAGIDEIRPGNFVFNDLMQVQIGSTHEDNVAIAVACPVISKNQPEKQLIIHSGSVHLSSEYIIENKIKCYGKVALFEENSWSKIIPETSIISLTQEHGIIQTTEKYFKKINIGDMLAVIPIHSCLVMNLNDNFITI